MEKFTIPQIAKEVSWFSINWKELPSYTSASPNYVTREDIYKFVDWRIREIAKVFGVNAGELKKLVIVRNGAFYVELDKMYTTLNGRSIYNVKFQEVLKLLKLPDTRPYTSKTYKITIYVLKKIYLEWKKFKEEVLFNESY